MKKHSSIFRILLVSSILLPGLIFIGLITSSSGCNNKYAEEDSRLDSLDMKLQVAEMNLHLDQNLFELRAELIEDNIKEIKEMLRDTIDVEYGTKMTRYKAIMKKYEYHIKMYTHWIKELNELQQQVKDLRHDLHKKGMSREQFKKYYYTELKDVDALLEGSEQLKKELYELEPEYMRLSKFAEQQIKLLRLQDSAR